MANLWLDLKGPILADTVYVNGTLDVYKRQASLPAPATRCRSIPAAWS